MAQLDERGGVLTGGFDTHLEPEGVRMRLWWFAAYLSRGAILNW